MPFCLNSLQLQQTMNTTSTQMTGVGFFVSNAEDKLIQPGEYCTADEYWALVLNKVSCVMLFKTKAYLYCLFVFFVCVCSFLCSLRFSVPFCELLI